MMEILKLSSSSGDGVPSPRVSVAHVRLSRTGSGTLGSGSRTVLKSPVPQWLLLGLPITDTLALSSKALRPFKPARRLQSRRKCHELVSR